MNQETKLYETSNYEVKKQYPNDFETTKQYTIEEIQEGILALEQANRKYKDRLFRFIFQDKKNLLSLYNAMNGSHYTDEDQLEIFTVENVLYMNFKGDISFLVVKIANRVELLHLFDAVIAIASPLVHLVRYQQPLLLVVTQGLYGDLHQL